MIALRHLVPLNHNQEKERFFADESYNPQFLYADHIPLGELSKHGLPQRHYLDLAKTILDAAYAQHSEEDLFATEGPLVNQDEVTRKVGLFLRMHDLEKRYKIVWSSTFVSRTSVTSDTIKLRLPCDFRQEGLIGMLYHEIGTHVLRRINYEQQPWYKKRKKYGFQDQLRTEEGLAVLHGLLPHTMKLAFVQAIRYIAVDYSQHHSFVELWQFLKPYVQNPERRWIICSRMKRGMTDTSQPGGHTKDLVYLEGMVEVWRYLKQHDYDISPLYYGKLAYQDVAKAVQLNPQYAPLLPSFFVSDTTAYKEKLHEIGQANFL